MPKTGRRPLGSGSVYEDSAGGFHARIYLRDGRRVDWRRPTSEQAEAVLEEMVELHRADVAASHYRYYIAYIREPARKRPPRSGVSKRVRFAVLERDGFRCVYCGTTAADEPLVVDHVQPIADGGTDDFDNLATACKPCNQGKAGRSLLAPIPSRA